MPWLVKEVTTELQEMVSSRDLLTGIASLFYKELLLLHREMNCRRYCKRNIGNESGNLCSTKR